MILSGILYRYFFTIYYKICKDKKEIKIMKYPKSFVDFSNIDVDLEASNEFFLMGPLVFLFY